MKKQNKRQFPRTPIYFLVKYRPQGASESTMPVASVSRNISLDGLLLRVKDPLTIGQNLEIEINMPVFGKSIKARLKTVWARPVKGTDLFDVGARFLEIGEDDRKDVLDYISFINKTEREGLWSFRVGRWLAYLKRVFRKDGGAI
ncbi:MAG: PilZ domain-containing protein [Candidatus Omnitrophica bacterium]|nr:PilZ domain-containing protein [Candidatus Omnitrophota bacterium]